MNRSFESESNSWAEVVSSSQCVLERINWQVGWSFVVWHWYSVGRRRIASSI